MSNQSDIAIKVENLSKVFKLYSKPADMIFEFLTGIKRHQEFWALKDVSFDINRGETVGIVGANGSGKSTLLKILAGTLAHSSGEFRVQGKLGAILELGSGFHPECTGRENIFMGGLCLGMTKDEIATKEDEIIEFSGLRHCIDNKFRTYSSGMQARLTFSLAINLEPEVLIIDEALAAGDAIFVNKSLSRIRKICDSDTTLLFVSHSLEMVQSFCRRAIWLHGGRCVMDGDVQSVCKAYQRYVWEQSEEYLKSASMGHAGVTTAKELVETGVNGPVRGIKENSEFFQYGSKQVKIEEFKVVNKDGVQVWQISSHDYVEFVVRFSGKWDDGWHLHCGCQIFTSVGALVFACSSKYDYDGFAGVANDSSSGIFRFVFESFMLGAGQYNLSPILTLFDRDGDSVWADFHDRVYSLGVVSSKYKHSYIVEHPVRVKVEVGK